MVNKMVCFTMRILTMIKFSFDFRVYHLEFKLVGSALDVDFVLILVQNGSNSYSCKFFMLNEELTF